MTAVMRTLLLVSCSSLFTACGTGQNFADNFGLAGARASAEPLYRSMTDSDVVLANAALDRALERNLSGARTSWRNRGNGNNGSITPLRSYRASNGGYCRDYQEELMVGGDREQYTATACRDRRGVWQPIN